MASTKRIEGWRDTPVAPGAGWSWVTNGRASMSTGTVTVLPAITVALALPWKAGGKPSCAICSRWENGTSHPRTSIPTGPGGSPRKSTERFCLGSTSWTRSPTRTSTVLTLGGISVDPSKARGCKLRVCNGAAVSQRIRNCNSPPLVGSELPPQPEPSKASATRVAVATRPQPEFRTTPRNTTSGSGTYTNEKLVVKPQRGSFALWSIPATLLHPPRSLCLADIKRPVTGVSSPDRWPECRVRRPQLAAPARVHRDCFEACEAWFPGRWR
ncbi:hypothetical protein HRbin30_00541 [bacterium HR30]|nr:hypothetical protein HRbin30_00541 [bacterium HR30]